MPRECFPCGCVPAGCAGAVVDDAARLDELRRTFAGLIARGELVLHGSTTTGTVGTYSADSNASDEGDDIDGSGARVSFSVIIMIGLKGCISLNAEDAKSAKKFSILFI